MKYFTIGEIYRLGLLKTHKGTPYSSKGAVSVALRGIKKQKRETAHGPAYMVSQAQIDRLNKAFKI